MPNNNCVTRICVAKADPITKNECVNVAEIHIENFIPEFDTLEKAAEYYKKDAFDIYNILRNHLPQGTQCALLLLMLEKSTNLYRGI